MKRLISAAGLLLCLCMAVASAETEAPHYKATVQRMQLLKTTGTASGRPLQDLRKSWASGTTATSAVPNP